MLSLVPLILGGFYKNGIKLYQADLVRGYGLFKPLIMTVLGLLIGILVNLIDESLIKKSEEPLLDQFFSSFYPLYGILVASVISINTNLMLFIIVTFSTFILSKFLLKGKFNLVALSAIIIILLMNFTHGFTFLNTYEAGKVFHLEIIDYLLGKGSGGVNATGIILLLVSSVFLANGEYYKRVIPLFSAITLFICLIIYSGVKGDILGVTEYFFTNSVLFSFVYIAPDFITSSYTRKGKIIFGSLIGLITFGLFLIYPPISALGAIFIVSIFHSQIDKLLTKNG